jgi:hypothetical protein
MQTNVCYYLQTTFERKQKAVMHLNQQIVVGITS